MKQISNRKKRKIRNAVFLTGTVVAIGVGTYFGTRESLSDIGRAVGGIRNNVSQLLLTATELEKNSAHMNRTLDELSSGMSWAIDEYDVRTNLK